MSDVEARLRLEPDIVEGFRRKKCRETTASTPNEPPMGPPTDLGARPRQPDCGLDVPLPLAGSRRPSGREMFSRARARRTRAPESPAFVSRAPKHHPPLPRSSSHSGQQRPSDSKRSPSLVSGCPRGVPHGPSIELSVRRSQAAPLVREPCTKCGVGFDLAGELASSH